eukprot:TRINITY_DN67321_c6_g5_i1.p1 TRINITY_DN67321_c6_g5~~TRINITY_DN67321_c6_g5_i1.p1  ORF type:complete len:700 (-),score=30.08 TRINITY_DN67321_c6_g5_i1:203-2302(-)
MMDTPNRACPLSASHGTKATKCEECNQQFTAKTALEQHIKAVHSVRTCPHCTKTFTGESSLKQHMDAQHNTHKCNGCGHRFSSPARLEAHQASKRDHKNDKDGNSSCSCTSLRSSSIRQPSDEGSSSTTQTKCVFCSKEFQSEAALVAHLQDKHPICQQCCRRFKNTLALQQHNSDLHSPQPPPVPSPTEAHTADSQKDTTKEKRDAPRIISSITELQGIVNTLMSHTSVAFDLEALCNGVAEHGEVSLLQFSILGCGKQPVPFIVDVQKIGVANTGNVLRTFLESTGPLKLMWDCRRDAEALFHQLDIDLGNVCDLQLWCCLAEWKKNEHSYKMGQTVRRWGLEAQAEKMGFAVDTSLEVSSLKLRMKGETPNPTSLTPRSSSASSTSSTPSSPSTSASSGLNVNATPFHPSWMTGSPTESPSSSPTISSPTSSSPSTPTPESPVSSTKAHTHTNGDTTDDSLTTTHSTASSVGDESVESSTEHTPASPEGKSKWVPNYEAAPFDPPASSQRNRSSSLTTPTTTHWPVDPVWDNRPLSTAQIAYAAQDVNLLIRIYEKLGGNDGTGSEDLETTKTAVSVCSQQTIDNYTRAGVAGTDPPGGVLVSQLHSCWNTARETIQWRQAEETQAHTTHHHHHHHAHPHAHPHHAQVYATHHAHQTQSAWVATTSDAQMLWGFPTVVPVYYLPAQYQQAHAAYHR